jgi:transposase InsO family protein
MDGTATRRCIPVESAPRYLLRDRDHVFGHDFVKQVQAMGIKQVLSAPRSPWQRAYIERLIGTTRRECLDDVIVIKERSLCHHLRVFRELLPPVSYASGAREGQSGAARHPTARCWTDYLDPARLAVSIIATNAALPDREDGGTRDRQIQTTIGSRQRLSPDARCAFGKRRYTFYV